MKNKHPLMLILQEIVHLEQSIKNDTFRKYIWKYNTLHFHETFSSYTYFKYDYKILKC